MAGLVALDAQAPREAAMIMKRTERRVVLFIRVGGGVAVGLARREAKVEWRMKRSATRFKS